MSLDTVLQRGLTFQMPLPSAVNAGLYYFATDTGILWLSDGTAWAESPLSVVMQASGAGHAIGLVPDAGAVAGSTRYLREDATWNAPAGGGGGALASLGEVLLTAPAASIDFTAIPQTFRHLRLVFVMRSTGAGNNDSYEMRFNGDANSGHYQSYEGYLGGNNPDVESTAGIIGYGPASTSPAGESLRGEIVIPMYASTSFDHGYHMVGTMDYAGYHRLMLAGGVWLTTGAITEITLFADNGNLVPGSMASLYGMN